MTASMTVLSVVLSIERIINLLLAVVLFGAALYAFVCAVRASPRAYDVASKRTKGFWLAVTGGGLFASLLSLYSSFYGGSGSLVLQLAAAVAVGIFLADVKPAVVPRRGR